MVYVLYSEVFASESRTNYFNRAVDRIRTDPRCVELLGSGKKITAYGEETNNKWQRARPIAWVFPTDGGGMWEEARRNQEGLTGIFQVNKK